MLKILRVLFIILFANTISAQVAMVDWYIINEGMESDYLKLENVWKEFHQESVDNGEKLRWAVWKVDSEDLKPLDNITYLVINVFESEQQMKNFNWNQSRFNSIIKSRLKGKMSSSSIRKILAKDVKNENYQHVEKVLSQTPLVGGDLKPGDKMYLHGMTKLSDEYEKFETEFWKPRHTRLAMTGKKRQWILSETIDRNMKSEECCGSMTHVTWNFFSSDFAPLTIDQQNASMKRMDFKTRKLMDTFFNDIVELGKRYDATLVMRTK